MAVPRIHAGLSRPMCMFLSLFACLVKLIHILSCTATIYDQSQLPLLAPRLIAAAATTTTSTWFCLQIQYTATATTSTSPTTNAVQLLFNLKPHLTRLKSHRKKSSIIDLNVFLLDKNPKKSQQQLPRRFATLQSSSVV